METTATESFRSGLCLHTSRAIDVLKIGKPGDTIDREQMAKTIGRDCDTGSLGYGNVQSAIRHVERVNGIVWRWDRTRIAWTCLDNDQRAVETSSSLPRIRRMAGRALVVGSTVDQAKLNESDRRQFDLSVIRLGLAKTTSGADFGKKLETVAKPTELSSDKLLALMKQS